MKRMVSMVLAVVLMIGVLPMNTMALEDGKIHYKVIVTPQYEDVGRFSDGLAPVKTQGKWGYIDKSGKMVIEAKYDFANAFSEGKAIVETLVPGYETEFGNYVRLGFIDTAGKYTPFVGRYYDTIKDEFAVGEILALSADPSSYQDDFLPRENFFHNGYFMGQNNDQDSLFDFTGKAVNFGENIQIYFSSVYNEGIASAELLDGENKLSWIDTKGNSVLALPTITPDARNPKHVFRSAYGFNGGVCGVWIEDLEGKTFQFGLIDKTGKLLFAGPYDRVYYSGVDYARNVVSGGLISLRNATTEKWGAVDIHGNVVVPFQYEELRLSSEGLVSAKLGGKLGYIDTKGNMVIAAKYDGATSFVNGYAVVAEGDKTYCIDRLGAKIPGSETINTKAYFPKGTKDTYTVNPSPTIVIEENNKYGFAEMTYVPAPPKADEMETWAYEEAVKAMELGLIPTYLQNQYFADITRIDFVELIVAAIEEKTGKDIDVLVKEKTGKTLITHINAYPFNDASNSNVIAATALGIINGAGNGQFMPLGKIQREDAASLLMRAAKLVGGDVAVKDPAVFADNAAVSSYAKEAVNYVSGLKIMNGTGDEHFSPKDTYTRQQAYVTIYRLFMAVK